MRALLRSVWRDPLFPALAALLLAAGIGANALILTAVNVLLLRPVPVAHPEQIARLGVLRSSTHISYDHAYLYARLLRERAHSFSDVLAANTSEVGFASGAQVESITAKRFPGTIFRRWD